MNNKNNTSAFALNNKIKNPFIIMKKELMTYYSTPIMYIVTFVFLIVTGWFFFSTFFFSGIHL